MTALERYQRLEATGLWREGSDATPPDVFRQPDGVIISDAFKLSPVRNGLEIQHAWLNIHETTSVARDTGATLDVDLVLYGLDLVKRRKCKKAP